MKAITTLAAMCLTAHASAQDIGERQPAADRRARDAQSSPALAPTLDYQTPTQQVDKFVRDIVLCGRQNKTTRWLALPRLEVTATSPALKGFVESSFASITQATGLNTPGDGVLHVFVGTSRDFTALDIAKRRQLKMVGKDGCMFWQDKDHSLKEALVFLKDSPDQTEEFQQHVLFHNLLAGFGFMKNSPQFHDSTFGGNNTFDLKLSPLDNLLISFCYQHVPPAAQSSDVSKLLKLHWNKPAAGILPPAPAR
ncbi:hypothetical protein [Prosthecobacter sp.]|uniref:hypothetical protein n=1 Tax=Prosthecobacter sp. TaxID=1965333 RepID=UPI002ABC591B|nr:hypothetical protein [Prosthecobacter sp.]MDZ4401897.1 hypothetical protein [Prosthecobacter sp.]